MKAVDVVVFLFFFLAFANILGALTGVSIRSVENEELSPVTYQNGQWQQTNWWSVFAQLLPGLPVNLSSPAHFVVSIVNAVALACSVGGVIYLVFRVLGGQGVSGTFLMQALGVCIFAAFYFSYAGKVGLIFAGIPWLNDVGLGWVPILFTAFTTLVGMIAVLQMMTGVSAKFAE